MITRPSFPYPRLLISTVLFQCHEDHQCSGCGRSCCACPVRCARNFLGPPHRFNSVGPFPSPWSSLFHCCTRFRYMRRYSGLQPPRITRAIAALHIWKTSWFICNLRTRYELYLEDGDSMVVITYHTTGRLTRKPHSMKHICTEFCWILSCNMFTYSQHRPTRDTLIHDSMVSVRDAWIRSYVPSRLWDEAWLSIIDQDTAKPLQIQPRSDHVLWRWRCAVEWWSLG